MLESAYSGEIPFQVGRTIISPQAPQSLRPAVRGNQKVRALLIGDPRGRSEGGENGSRGPRVAFGARRWLRLSPGTRPAPGIGSMSAHPHPQRPVERRVWDRALFRSHEIPEGAERLVRVRWNHPHLCADQRAADGPAALVFSSSCESASAAEKQTLRYEDQAFDLPSAFVQAGSRRTSAPCGRWRQRLPATSRSTSTRLS